MFLSIIIPVYNAQEYLMECINSIEPVLNKDIELILVDDGSMDNSGRICDDLSRNYKNIVVYHKKNGGSASARNVGIKNARGEYVTFIDCDDYVITDRYQEIIKEMIKVKPDVLCYGFIQKGHKRRSIKVDQVDRMFMKYPVYMNSVCNKFIKRKLLIENHIFMPEEVTVCEDFLFIYSIFGKTADIVYLNINAYIYRMSEKSVTHMINRKEVIEKEKIVIGMLKNMVNDCNNEIIRYRTLLLAMRYVTDLELYSPQEYRQINSQGYIWVYSFNPIYWVLTICLNKKIDCIPFVICKLKEKMKRRKLYE